MKLWGLYVHDISDDYQNSHKLPKLLLIYAEIPVFVEDYWLEGEDSKLDTLCFQIYFWRSWMTIEGLRSWYINDIQNSDGYFH